MITPRRWMAPSGEGHSGGREHKRERRIIPTEAHAGPASAATLKV